MKDAFLLVAATALAVSCGGSPAAPMAVASSPAPSPSVGLSGTWAGTGVDSQGSTVVTWALTQTANTVSGTVKTDAVNPNDGSCHSCHRKKSGSVIGTISGTTLTLVMSFAAGLDGDPTPICSSSFMGTAPTTTGDTLTAAYTGDDSCEGAFLNGTLAMTRKP